MAPLTIRNLSVTPLALTRVERFGADAVQRDARGLAAVVWGLLRTPYDYLVGGSASPSGGGPGSGLVPKAGAAPTAADAIAPPVGIGAFATARTAVQAPDPASEVLRLTFQAAFGAGGTVRRTYTVDVPGASPRSIELQPVDGADGADGADGEDAGAAGAAARFTAVYNAAGAHLAVLSSAALAQWMGTVDGAWPLSSLSLPGTHNSPACHYALPSVRCQAVDVRAQLDNGVRFLDVRVSVHAAAQPHADPRLALVHSVFSVGLVGAHTFGALYDDVCRFLDAHPSETVLLSIKREGAGAGTDADLARQLLRHYTGGHEEKPAAAAATSKTKRPPGQPEPWRWYTAPRIPSLDEARGRIVLLRRFRVPDEDAFRQMHGGAGWGLDGSAWPDNCADDLCGSGPVRLQDFYDVLQTPAIDTKIRYVRGLLATSARTTYRRVGGAAATGAAPDAPPPPPPLFINFLSASNFFNVRCWPENIAARVNPSVIEYLCVQHGEAAAEGPEGSAAAVAGDGSTGIVVTDWAGHRGDWDLLRCIVAWNARLQLKQ